MRTIVILGPSSDENLKKMAQAVKQNSKPLKADDHLHKVTKTDLTTAVVMNELPSDQKTFQ